MAILRFWFLLDFYLPSRELDPWESRGLSRAEEAARKRSSSDSENFLWIIMSNGFWRNRDHLTLQWRHRDISHAGRLRKRVPSWVDHRFPLPNRKVLSNEAPHGELLFIPSTDLNILYNSEYRWFLYIASDLNSLHCWLGNERSAKSTSLRRTP